MRRHLSLALLVTIVLPATASAAEPSWERQKEAIGCDDAVGSSPFHHGASASALYDSTFVIGHVLPPALLDGYVPQGLGTWPGWGGPGNDLLLQTAYNDDAHSSVVVGMVPGGGATAMAKLKRPDGTAVDAHVGGVAVVGSWMYVPGPKAGGLPTILRYKLKAVRRALAKGGDLKALGEQRIRVGTPGFAASFVAAEGGTLWVGTFDSESRNRMYRLAVGPKGGLTRVGGAGSWIQVPKKSQGLAVTPTHFIFSTSHGSQNRSNVYVVRRGKKFLDRAYPQDLVCFAAPSMSEGMAISGNQVFLTFESGSFRYRADPCDKPILEGDCTRNVITHLHRAPLATLLGMT